MTSKKDHEHSEVLYTFNESEYLLAWEVTNGTTPPSSEMTKKRAQEIIDEYRSKQQK